MFSASTKDGPVRTALAAADVVAVAEVEPQRRNRQVALDVGLLVDGELDAAVLDGLRRIGAQVEGHDLSLTARLLDSIQRGRSRSGRRG